MEKYFKRVAVIILSCMLIINNIIMGVNAEELCTDDISVLLTERAGFEELEAVEISDAEATELLSDLVASDEFVAQGRDWNKYSSDYLYERMSDVEKAYYEELDEACSSCIASKEDVYCYSSDDDPMYILDSVSYDGLTYDEARGLVYIFLYQNPQYYFISSKYLYNSTTKTIWLSVYDIFAEGDNRAAVTDTMFAKVDSWISEINKEATAYEKQKKAHDIVCINNTYKAGDYDQSAYSAIIEKQTVCAGYTKMFSILTNGVGIDTIGIIGSNHAWNKCLIDGAWYNVDTTWDDYDGYISYSYFDKADTSDEFSYGHSPYSWYDGRLPVSSADYSISEEPGYEVGVEAVSLNKTEVTLSDQLTIQLSASISPENATDKSVIWMSTDENIATVSDTGLVTAKGNGNVTIKVITNNGSKWAACNVKIYNRKFVPRTNATVTAEGIYVAEHTREKIVAGLVATPSEQADLEYRWLACDTSVDSEKWTVIQDWTLNNEWLNWIPDNSGDYVIVAQVRVVGNESSQAESAVGIPHHKQIKGKCQMPYTGDGGGYLIGIESYDNPNQEYTYELLVLDCTLLAQGKDAWIWSTGRCKVPETSFWAVWQPQYGYYWTLFRVYDADGKMIDQECYSFVNAY